MFNWLKKLFGSDVPDTPEIAKAPKEEKPTLYSDVKTSVSSTTKAEPAKKAPAKKTASKPAAKKTTAAKKAPAKKPAATKTGDAPRRRGRPPKNAS